MTPDSSSNASLQLKPVQREEPGLEATPSRTDGSNAPHENDKSHARGQEPEQIPETPPNVVQYPQDALTEAIEEAKAIKHLVRITKFTDRR